MVNSSIIKAVDSRSERLCRLAKEIWDNPEMGWHEYKAVSLYKDFLESEGFKVEVGAYGMPTAIKAVWGSGKPAIGFLAEYDCLPGLSQKVSPDKDPVVEGGPGHGCGHNLLGAGCLGACIGLKAALEESGREGTVIFYGCPAEEQLTGKSFMALKGAFKESDFAIAWHPSTDNASTVGVSTGVEAAVFHFKGRTAHAAGNPQDGRSALDAVQLMNIGVEFLREHVTDDVRMHYTITEGGLAPNIVPENASVKYFVRALTREKVLDAYQRVIKCAEGAAHMTDTSLEIEHLGGIYPTMPNRVMAGIMQKMREEIPPVEYTEEELEFADRINSHSPSYKKGVTPPIDWEFKPLSEENNFASTDVGDVMHIIPTVSNSDCTAATLSGGHSWMITACSGSSIGMKGMIRAAKVMAAGAYYLIEHPELQEAAKKEFEKNMAGTSYECPVAGDVKWPYQE
ncbi:MAG: amidohydrolase [Oscillospiraceae bacterium]|jgi:aminobenzoyl-glutamate utilization protein B